MQDLCYFLRDIITPCNITIKIMGLRNMFYEDLTDANREEVIRKIYAAHDNDDLFVARFGVLPHAQSLYIECV